MKGNVNDIGCTAFKQHRWLWIELIGFEVNDADFGVNRWLDKAGFIPEAVSLLLADPEFVHGHCEDDQRVLGPAICSYGGHPYNEERDLQQWNARQLKGLIRELQSHGIKVFFTHFDHACEKFPELNFVNKRGDIQESLCPYKRLADGRLYRDFYLPLLIQTVLYYGFDGYQAGDGMAHPRIPIYEGDFSDDTVGQFLEWSGLALPANLDLQTEGTAEKIKIRAAWIWNNHRLDLIRFQRSRTLEFWTKAAEMLHKEGRLLYFNSCWTRDPFEALYRYGVDYVALANNGIDGFIAETAAAALEYGGDLPYGERGFDDWEPARVMSRFATALMMLKAGAPDTEVLFMNGVKDTNEAWYGLRHAPVNLESEILTYTGLFQNREADAPVPTTSGMIVTLSDGLAKHEWEWLNKCWNLGYSLQPQKILGAAVYWSDAYPEALVQDFIKTRRCPFDRIQWKMTVAGAPLLSTVRAEHLQNLKQPLVVIHPHLLPDEEWEKIMAWKGAPILLVGGERAGISADYYFKESEGEDALTIAVCNWAGVPPVTPALTPPEAFDASEIEEPFYWPYDLKTRQISPEFFEHAADWVLTVCGGVRVLENRHDVRAWGYQLDEGLVRVHVRNDGFYYRTAMIDLGKELKQVKTLTSSPGNPVHINGSVFRFVLAGKSMGVFEVKA